MKNVVLVTLAKIDKDCSLDKIKSVLKAECDNAAFEITEADYIDMLTDVLYALA